MRVRTAWLVIFAVNVLWAAAFIGYARRSTAPVVRGGEILRPDAAAKVVANVPGTSGVSRAVQSTLSASAGTNAPVAAPAQPPGLTPAGREFGWQDVTNDVYTNYIARLRLAGCPEKQVRSIVASDVNELFDKRRLEHSIRIDTPWWKSDNYFGILPINNVAAANFDDERRQLLEKLLGPGWENTIKLPPLNTGTVPLAGPVLGALPTETWNAVQEVCEKSMERRNNYVMAHINEGIQEDSPEMAKLRDFTRTELAKILTPEQVEEFLLRYSRNATRLRQDMRGIDLTPDEFRKIFRALDPLEHKMQLDYGALESLSAKQKEQFEAQRDRAIRETLSADRYQQYLQTKDPLYRQAQMTAMQYGMTGKAIQPIYQLQKTMEAKRLQITQNNALTPEQKAQALQSVAIEHQQTLQRMMGDQTLR